MKNIINRINEIKQYGYHLDIGTVINQAFENYKKVALTVGAVILVLTIIVIVVIFGVAGVAVGTSDFTKFVTDYNVMQFSTTALIIKSLTSIIVAGLVAPVTAGIFKIAHHAETNTEFGFSTTFDYYKTTYFKDLFLSAVIVAFFSNGINVLITSTIPYVNGSLIVLLTAISGLISILISLFSILIIPSIIFGNLNATEAIKVSFLLVRKRFWTILILYIISIILALVGMIGLCIGIFFTLPIVYSMVYIIYRNALSIENEDMLDEIGSDWNS